MQFKKDRIALVALIIIAGLFLIAVFDDFIAGNRPILIKMNNNLL